MEDDIDLGVRDALTTIDNLQDVTTNSDSDTGDARDGLVYIASDEIRTALKVAMLTDRPLLLGGPPGCGKSSLASYIARNLDARYLEYTVTDDARPTDISWRFDAVRRLGDAQAQRLDPSGGTASIAPYIEPGPLWWAINPESARKHGLPGQADANLMLRPPDLIEGYQPEGAGTVLLIDEIDKADAAFCNGILVPVGSRRIPIPQLNITVSPASSLPGWSPLTIITTNNERDLPEAFLRRCVVLRLESPDADQLQAIADRHFPTMTDEVRQLLKEISIEVTNDPYDNGRPVSTAEFLDLARVATTLTRLGQLDETTLDLVKQVTLAKHEIYGRRDHRVWRA